MNDRLREIEERLQKITPGPWRFEENEIRADLDPQTTDSGIADCSVLIASLPQTPGLPLNGIADLEFIARCPEDIAWLLDDVNERDRQLKRAILWIATLEKLMTAQEIYKWIADEALYGEALKEEL